MSAVGLGFDHRSVGSVVLSLVRLACEEEGLEDRFWVFKVIMNDVDEESTIDEVGDKFA